jgi:hypothetical protein
MVQATLHTFGQASLQMANPDISLCVWILRWSLLSRSRMSGLLVPSKPREQRTEFGYTRLPILWEASHRLRKRFEVPNFYLRHPLYTQKKAHNISWREGYLKEIWRSVNHTCNRRYWNDLNTSLAWWKYNKHNSFTQETSWKRTHDTCNISQRSPEHH